MRVPWKFLALYSGYVAALHTFDGPWREWKRDGDTVDNWTWTHVAWGMIARRMGLGRGEFMVLGALNEVVELGVRTWRPDLLWGTPESTANVVVDLASNLVGWEAGSYFE